jgi:hypothetical protein
VTAVPVPAAHAGPVNAEDELFGVENLRELRLALDVIHLFFPLGPDSGAITAALQDLHERLCADENEQLRLTGIADRYLIIRPVNPYSPRRQRTCGALPMRFALWPPSA